MTLWPRKENVYYNVTQVWLLIFCLPNYSGEITRAPQVSVTNKDPEYESHNTAATSRTGQRLQVWTRNICTSDLKLPHIVKTKYEKSVEELSAHTNQKSFFHLSFFSARSRPSQILARVVSINLILTTRTLLYHIIRYKVSKKSLIYITFSNYG